MSAEKTARRPKKRMVLLLLAAVAVFAFSHLYALDRDLPPWGVINYQPIDEGAYSMLALNAYNYGTMNPDLSADGIQYDISPHLKTNVIGNGLTYLGLKILGDNYYGFRMGSVICSFLNYILIGLIINELRKKYAPSSRGAVWLAVGMMAYLLVDFCFLMSGRVVETSIYRLLFVLLTVYIFLRVQKSFLKALLVGFLATFSMFCIYATNSFLLLACAFTLAGIWIIGGFREFLRYLSGAILGIAAAFLVCEAYFLTFWKIHAVENILQVIGSFSNQQGYTVDKSIHGLIGIVVRFISSNANLYDTALIFFCMAALPCIFRLIREKDCNVVFLFSIILAFFLQTLVSEDYVVRKYLIICPVTLMLAYLILVSGTLRDFFSRMAGKKRVIRALYTAYILLCTAVCWMIPIYRLKLIWNMTFLDFSDADRYVILPGSVLSVAVLAVWFLSKCWKRTSGERRHTGYALAVIAAASVLTVNIYMDYTYIFANKTYCEKQIMMEIGESAGDNYVIGAVFPIGYTLYNNIRPVISSNEDIPSAMARNPDMLYLDYSYADVKGYIDSIFEGGPAEVRQYRVFDRNFLTFGKQRRIELMQNAGRQHNP